MKYVEAEKSYFGNFIEGGLDKISEYIANKSLNKVWGDDVEI